MPKEIDHVFHQAKMGSGSKGGKDNELYIALQIQYPMAEEKTLSFGQKAAGVSFNPSNNPIVDRIKVQFAEIIDELNDQRNKVISGEAKRYFSKAISHAEDAQMNAVKAVTWQH